MKHPERWRETVDPFSLKYNNVKLLEVLGYPHAGNDVFHAKVLYQGREVSAFIKVERQKGADIANEVSVISGLSFPFLPKVLDYSLEEPRFIVTKEAEGERLSAILENDPQADVLSYLYRQGAALSEIHSVSLDCTPVKDRRFFSIPLHEHFVKCGLETAENFLTKHTPYKVSKCFVHGDFHYANILWKGGNISCVLDYELAGMGVREFDMAWSVFLRPGQKFLITHEEREAFLKGYARPFDRFAFYYYLILIAVHFYHLGDQTYRKTVTDIIQQTMALCGALQA